MTIIIDYACSGFLKSVLGLRVTPGHLHNVKPFGPRGKQLKMFAMKV